MRTFHGLSCVHPDEWCQCTEINVLTYRDGKSSLFMNARAWAELAFGDRPKQTAGKAG